MDRLNELMVTRPKPPARLFKETEQQIEAFRLKGEQRSHKELADLNAYYHILVDDLEKEEIEIMVDTLNRSALVEIAYVPAIPSEPSLNIPPYDIAPVTPSFVGQQGYLGAAPVGINAQWAWTTPPYSSNSRGSGIRLTDIERGWNLQHEDLKFVTGDLLNGINDIANTDHGTAVLGEIIGVDNSYGVTGMSNLVDISMYGVVAPFWNAPPSHTTAYIADTAAAINSVALSTSRTGDVILLELEIPARIDQNLTHASCFAPISEPLLPMENEPAIRNAIVVATALGRIVIEPAANGGQNLDTILPQSSSGAILVGAGTSTAPHNPLCGSNYGDQVDLQGWGA